MYVSRWSHIIVFDFVPACHGLARLIASVSTAARWLTYAADAWDVVRGGSAEVAAQAQCLVQFAYPVEEAVVGADGAHFAHEPQRLTRAKVAGKHQVDDDKRGRPTHSLHTVNQHVTYEHTRRR